MFETQKTRVSFLAICLGLLLGSMLYVVQGLDPLTFLIVPLFLAMWAIAACYFPARKAARIKPMPALRCE